MTSQWNSKSIGKHLDMLDSGMLEEEIVILMQGKNGFGDRIYSYVKLTLKDLMRLKAAMQAAQPFSPSDFGSVVAAGKGDPPPEVHADITSTYRYLDSRTGQQPPAAPPPEQKAWDEY